MVFLDCRPKELMAPLPSVWRVLSSQPYIPPLRFRLYILGASMNSFGLSEAPLPFLKKLIALSLRLALVYSESVFEVAEDPSPGTVSS